VQQELDDPRVHGVTITAVEVSADLSSAKIYFTTLAEGEEVEQAAVALNKAAGFLRRALLQRVVLRSVPQLRFWFDESVKRGAALARLIERAIAEDSEHEIE
jgi:ribosome-binding factor A